MRWKINIKALLILPLLTSFSMANTQDYKIVDTGQSLFYDSIVTVPVPQPGEPFYGQDALYHGYQPDYADHGDGTVTDHVTGLMWQKYLAHEKMTYSESLAGADTCRIGGYDDWRLPSVKELYSLILFSGTDPSGPDPGNMIPFIDTAFFEFEYGDTTAGERIIDAQYASSTEYVGTTMMGDFTIFGVNFADGRIKGYGTGPLPGQTGEKKFFVRYVRGNQDYGINALSDNGDGTVTDNATGLMWDKNDSGEGLDWQEALAWAAGRNGENHLGYNDWRLPNAKELQSIIDYTRSPQTTGTAAIDPVFHISSITDEGGGTNYPFFWTGTTHASSNGLGGFAVYLAFGEALGWMEIPPGSGMYQLLDVHGAGAQRSDPKKGNPGNYPYGHGPQGDVVRIYNYVRLVRDAKSGSGWKDTQRKTEKLTLFPNPADNLLVLRFEDAAGKTALQVSDLTGRVCYEDELFFAGNDDCSLRLDGLAPGAYLITVISGNNLRIARFLKK